MSPQIAEAVLSAQIGAMYAEDCIMTRLIPQYQINSVVQ